MFWRRCSKVACALKGGAVPPVRCQASRGLQSSFPRSSVPLTLSFIIRSLNSSPILSHHALHPQIPPHPRLQTRPPPSIRPSTLLPHPLPRPPPNHPLLHLIPLPRPQRPQPQPRRLRPPAHRPPPAPKTQCQALRPPQTRSRPAQTQRRRSRRKPRPLGFLQPRPDEPEHTGGTRGAWTGMDGAGAEE